MSGRERERSRREHPSRSEEKGHHGRSNPPSRHLWVGNLSHDIDESIFARQFLQFGEIESVAFQPGRSYAFVNFRNEDDAFAAIRELQGFSLAGNPLRIEFTKAEKSMPRDDGYPQHRDEQRSTVTVRASPFSQRDSRTRHFSTDAEKPKMKDKDGDPSEVLWIGFPAQLKVDEFILRKAFAPFGEIDKITAFPGRTYAFVRFRNIMAASRAKETLQGKLFGNPRVHICFARSESGGSNRERDPLTGPSSPHFRGYRHPGSSEDLRYDRDFGDLNGNLNRRSPGYISNFERGDPNVTSFGRKNNVWPGGDEAFEHSRFPELGPELGKPGKMYGQRSSPSRGRIGQFREFSPERFSRHSQVDDLYDLPEEPLLFRGAKKPKTGTFRPESELVEYPSTNSGQANQVPSRSFHDFQPDSYENFDSEPFGYKQMLNHQMKPIQPYREKSDQRSASHDSLQFGTVPLLKYPEQQRLTPEPNFLSKKEEWKWEGTIAKGGTPICRARCFPVGKELDMNLPEFLDCAARTSLDMLTKHYYQATGSWVIFFVPASDSDMVFYNEFMTYLGEKQRAAVAKLDDNNTLFLVPPSEFSEKVLKVPGRLSISGVVLRSEQLDSTYGSFHHQQALKKEPNFASLRGDSSALNRASPSRPYPSLPTMAHFEGPRVGNMSVTQNFSVGPPHASLARPAHHVGDLPEHEYVVHQKNTMVPGWSSHDMQNISSDTRNIAPQAINSTAQSKVQGYNPVPISSTGSQPLQDRPPMASSMPAVGAFQSEQLAQLATSLLGQQRQLGAASMGSGWAQQTYMAPNNQVSSEISSSQYAQLQQQQQISNIPPGPQRELQLSSQVNRTPQYPEQEDGDTEKRLQATLQLAASLLQQIQQGKRT